MARTSRSMRRKTSVSVRTAVVFPVPSFWERTAFFFVVIPEEMALLMTNADADIIPALAICGFAGLRQSEMVSLDWSEIDLRRGFIEVKGRKAKTKQRRLVPIAKNLKAWLAPYVKKDGPVLESSNDVYLSSRRTAALAAGLKKWPRNCLRHSYVSYRLAGTKDAAKVALEAGHSAAMLFSNYRQLVTPAEARRWFSIAPRRARNVVSLPVGYQYAGI